MSRQKPHPTPPPVPPSGGEGGKPPPSTGSEFRWFVGRFLGSLLGFSVLVTLTSVQNHLGWLEVSLAAAAEWGGKLFGIDVVRDGHHLSVSSFQLEINHECTAFFVLLIYASFLIAYPASWLERLKGFVLGTGILMVVNAIRLAMLVIIVGWWPKLFDYFHEYFFQVMFLGLITVLAHRWLGSLEVQRDVLVLPR